MSKQSLDDLYYAHMAGLNDADKAWPDFKQAIVEAVEGLIGPDDRDYSNDNTDEQSKMILVATATACNELRAEPRQAIKEWQ